MDLWKAGISGVVLAVALFIIVHRSEDDAEEARKWAYGAVGFILEYLAPVRPCAHRDGDR
jgi:hypothetical protein